MKRHLPFSDSYIFIILLGLQVVMASALTAQVQLSNGSPSITLDFSASMPASVATSPGTAFAGAGFESNPTVAGRLNSNAWAATGWNDGALAFGGTRITANTDYTRGSVAAAVSTGGFYAYTGTPQSTANPCLMIQPGGTDWAPGTLTLRIVNTGTTNITELAVSYNIYIRNDQPRANSFNFSYSTDSIGYTTVPTLDYTSPVAADASGWVLVGSAPSRSTTLTGLNIAPGSAIFIRWSGADVSGSGSRDEFGLDDIALAATFETLPDYAITLTGGGALSITDLSGNGDVLTMSQVGTDLRFAVSPTSRTYSFNGGPVTAFTTPADIPLAGISGIEINAGAGNDTIHIAAFTSMLPSLTINGGTGDDAVNFNGDITFTIDAYLDVDLQNDDPTPGVDQVTVASNANLMLSGTGTATIKVSRNVLLNSGGSIETVDGDLIVEANQQASPTSGDFIGVSLDGGLLKVNGNGALMVFGKGGNTGGAQTGIRLQSIGQILGGSGTVTIEGTGGASTGPADYGVFVNTFSTIGSSGGDVKVNGQGGGTGGSNSNFGVIVITNSTISAGGSGTVKVEGMGGTTTGSANAGIIVSGANSMITSSGGDVEAKGFGGGSGTSPTAFGINLESGGTISAGMNGNVSVEGTGGSGSGALNYGIRLAGLNSKITSSGGDVLITAIEGNGSSPLAFVTEGSGSVTTAVSGGQISIYANSMDIKVSTFISTQLTDSVTLQPYTAGVPIDLGSAMDPIGGPLGLSDDELDRITTGTLTIGDAISGRINVSFAITRPVATDVVLRTGDDIEFLQSFNTAGGNLLLNPGTSPAGVYPTFNGIDGVVDTLSFGSDLAIVINGTTPGDGSGSTYTQMTVSGIVDLTGVDLILSGSYSPSIPDSFILVVNDGVDPIIGSFNGLPEGATIFNILGSGNNAIITYIGGDGNDGVIRLDETYSFSITDPCTCNNDASPNMQDGTFGEEVTITGPAGVTLVVANGSTGLIGVSIGDDIPETPPGSGNYILTFDHLDATGYTLYVAEDDPANPVILTISNLCYYPVVSISGLNSEFCEGDPQVTLMGTALLGGGGGPANGTGEFFVNGGGPVANFDPNTPGVFTISYVFDAADNDPDAQHPGCISTAEQDVTVHDAPSMSENHTDETCPGVNDGTITITVNGGTMPFTFDWADIPGGNNSQNRVNLSPGTYYLSITDDNACTDSISVTILPAVDTEDPDISCPMDVTVECDASTDPTATGSATATDNCDPNPDISYTDDEDLSGCGGYTGTITRTWRAEDINGNVGECDQIITIVDTTPPTWDQNPLPQNITVECDDILDPEELTASDNCGGGPPAGPVVFINEIHYDNAGADVGEFIEIAGTAGLNLSGYSLVLYNGANPASAVVYNTLNLSGIIPDEGNGFGAVAFNYPVDGIQNGNNDGVALVQGTTVLELLSYEGSFTAGNGPAAGMVAVDMGVSQQPAPAIGLTLQRTGTGYNAGDFTWTGPVASSPGFINTNQTFQAPGAGIPVVFDEVFVAGACPQAGVLTRTWTATDACGNAITHTQTITVQDTTPPTWDQNPLPANVTVECDDVPSAAVLTAMDNCDIDLIVIFDEVRNDGSCENEYTLIRTWTATDDCGNGITHTQTITVQDTTPPTWDQNPLPQNITVECDDIPDPEELTASDNCGGGPPAGPVVFINEIHYDNAGADVGEFIEITGTAGLNLSGYSLVLYNGANPASAVVYNTLNLSGIIPDEGNGFGAVAFNFPVDGIQNGNNDGVALVQGTTVLELLSYEGSFTAGNGPAAGMVAVDMGVSQQPAPAIGLTLQRTGMGYNAGDFTWTGPVASSPGFINANQTFQAPGAGIPVVFDEVFVAGACPQAGELTRTWTATDACGNTITHTQVITVQDTTPPAWDQNPLPANVTVECDDVPSAAVLTAMDNCDPTINVVFTETRTDGNCPHNYTLTRTWMATDDCGNVASHTQIVTVQDTTPPVWDQDPLPQNITVACNAIPPPAVLTATDNCTGGDPSNVVFINEIHYDNVGTDQGEFIEIAGSAGLNLSGYSLVLYNGATPGAAVVYNTLNLSGIIPDEGNGTGALAFFYPVDGIQNGPNDGVALVQGTTVLELLSYEGPFTASNGPAAGMSSVDIGVSQQPAPPIGLSLQRIGTGMVAGDFTWTGPVAQSPGVLNANQNFSLPVPTVITYTFNQVFVAGACPSAGVMTRTWTATDACGNGITHTQVITVTDNLPPMFNPMLANITVECDAIPTPPVVQAVDGCGPTAGIQPWINELHYDNIGTDENEFFEIAGPAGIDLSNYTVYLYNGANGLVYDIRPLSGVIPNEGKNYGAIAFFLPVNGFQNGAPDGIAFVQGANTVVQFLSYEGAFVAVDGPAAGMNSVNIGVAQEPPPAIGLSLQLTGAGNQYNAFNWVGPVTQSPGVLNTNQLAGPVVVVVTYNETVIPGACQGQETRIRTWTASDACGNVATMTQVITVVDNTPPVALCRNVTLYLDGNGEVNLNPADIDNGSSDNCSPVTLQLSQSHFTCSDTGPNNVTLTVRDACGNQASCVAVVTVLDTIAPIIACPPGRIINLDPGLCCAVVSWPVPTVTDNCPFPGPSGQVNTVSDANNFNSVGGAVHFDINNTSGGPITITDLGMRISAGTIVNIYTKAGTYVGFQNTPGAWTLTTTADATVGPFSGAGLGNGTLTNAPIAGGWVIPPGVTGVTLHAPTASLQYTNGNGGNQLFSDSNLEISLGAAQNILWTGNFTPRVWNGYLRYETFIATIPPTQTEGPESGTELCKDDSPWTVSYEVFDASGNRGACSFTIAVNEYANPIKSLKCNNLVQVSLGENCDTEIGADMILEGGPYGCYDDYQVMIFNQQNIPLITSPYVGRAQIGGIWKVKVTDPDTGNHCWGNITVEDKMAPKLICADLVLSCGDEIPLAPAPFFFQDFPPLEQNVPYTNYWTGYMLDLQNKTPEQIQVTKVEVQAGLAGGAAGTYSLRAYMRNGTHLGNAGSPAGWTLVGEIQANITAGFPTVLLFEIPFTTPFIMSPNATHGLYIVANEGNGTAVRVVATLNNADTEDANLRIRQMPGRWVDGLFAGEVFTGENPRPQLKVFYQTQSDPVLVTDNCTPNFLMNQVGGNHLKYGELETNYSCDQNAQYARRITRIWTATDEWGNSTQCTQQIDIRRPSLASLVPPPNFDDLDQAGFDCQSAYPTPELIESVKGFGGWPAGGGCGSLQMAYADKVLNVCPGSYTIIRNWTFHDMCTGGIGTHDQVIKVLDKTPPTLFCPNPNNILVGKTNNNGHDPCTATVNLPWVQVTDDCSTTSDLTVYGWTTLPDGSVQIQNTMNAQGYFVFNLPVMPAPHQYQFSYVAIDACGNKSECVVSKPVRDIIPPVVICETFHIVALSDSVTWVPAVSFDDGSYDDCSMVTFTARRGTMNAAGAFIQHPCNLSGDFLYQPNVRFYCCDINHPTPVFVELRVRDAAGNDNFCMVPVTVVDKVRPTILCPPDITVQCGMPYTPTTIDTFTIAETPDIVIKNAFAESYSVPIYLEGFPDDARISDLDLRLRIDHELTSQLRITLISPIGTKAEVLTPNGCKGQGVPYPENVHVTFNDQAYNIATFQATGLKVAAPFTCTNATPSIGAFNQGHMKPQGDELKIFNGEELNGYWEIIVEDTAPLAGGIIREVALHIGYVLSTGLKPLVSDNAEECGLTVTHQDLGQPDKCPDNTFINRRWTVTDNSGNNTNCIQRVYFSDDTPLYVAFPCDQTIQCPIIDVVSEPFHTGDCELIGIEFNDNILVSADACYKVERTWIIKDWCRYMPDGNVDYTTTNINAGASEVTFSTAINPLFTARKINEGDRFTLRYVTSGSVEIPGLIEGDVYSVVRVSGTTVRFEFNTTKQAYVNITGQGTGPHIFRYANSDGGIGAGCGSCWEDDGDGYYRYVQVIHVVDNVPPMWDDCSNKELCSYAPDCEATQVELVCTATDDCAPADKLSYYWSIDLNNDGTEDITGVTADASGAYPLGTHRITFKVTDNCGNWNTCTKLFTIRDCKKPTPVCINGLSVDLMPNTGMATVWAESLEAGDSYDNCTEYNNLTFLVERLTAITPGQNAPNPGATNEVIVSCSDLPPATMSPIVEVVVWVGDEAGNWDYCITTIWVQDNMGACGNGQMSGLMAKIVNEENAGVELVEVGLSGTVDMQGLITDPFGIVSMGFVPSNGHYTVTPHKDIHPMNGVSTYDLLLIQKHLLGIKPLGSPYKMIAADVNNNCQVSVSDIIELRKMILTPGLNFYGNTSWRFVESSYLFPNPAKPCNFPEVSNLLNLPLGITSANFIGVKIGDVSGDAESNSLIGAETRSEAGKLHFGVADLQTEPHQLYEIVIRARDFERVQGYQYTLDLNPESYRIENVVPVWSELTMANFGLSRLKDGLITTSWHGSDGVTLDDDTPLFIIQIKALCQSRLMENMKINSRITNAEAYDANEALLGVRLAFDSGVQTGEEFELYQNEPNPASQLTSIGFFIPAATTTTFKVIDITGQVVYMVRGFYARGHHTILLNRRDLPVQGVYYYQLETATDRAMKRMVIVD